MEPSIIDYYTELPNGVNVIDRMNDELEILQDKYDLLKKTYEPEKSLDSFLRRACKTDNDMAKLLYKFYGEYNVCTSIRQNEWYFYDMDMKKWRLSDGGIELRIKLSDEIHNIYMKKAYHYINRKENPALDVPPGVLDPSQAPFPAPLDDISIRQVLDDLSGEAYMETGINLKNPQYKKKIMKECKEVFYDKDFFKNHKDIEDISEYSIYGKFPKINKKMTYE